MVQTVQLKPHIICYAKTKEVYAAYKKSRYKKEFQAAHASELAQHEAAKATFDALGGKPGPPLLGIRRPPGREAGRI